MFIQEGITGFFGRWLQANNDEFQPRRKLGSEVELENEESRGVNDSNTGKASSRIQENLESWNAMIAREEQGSKDHPVDVLEHCVEVADPVQVDGTSIEDATIRLLEALVNLDSHASSVTHQLDGSTSITHQPDGSTSFTSWNLVSQESLEPNTAYNPAQNPNLCINNPNPHHIKPTTNPMSNDPQTPNRAHSHKASECSKRKLNSLSPPNSLNSVYKKTKLSITLIPTQTTTLISSQPAIINPSVYTTPTSIPTSYPSRQSPKRITLKDQARAKAISQAKLKQGKGSSSENLNCSSLQKDEDNTFNSL